MDGKSCVVCREPVGLGDSIQHKCLHRTHGLCLRNSLTTGEKPNFNKCPHCEGKIDVTSQLIPEHEPSNYNGRDYIENPLTSTSLFSRVKNATKGWAKVDKEDTEDLVYLFSLGPKECPIGWLIGKKQDMGLHRMLAEGITIDNLIEGGYTWDDLMVFKDIRGGGERAIKALGALKCDATHFRDFPHVLSFDQVKADTGYLTPRHMVEVFGLYFPDGEEMGVVQKPKDTKSWTAQDLVNFGFTHEDLYGAGIEWVEQYEALNPTDELEQQLLGDKPEDFLNKLPSIEEEMQRMNEPEPLQRREPNPEPEPIRVPVLEPRVVVVHPASVSRNSRNKRFGHGLRKKRVYK
jgi:hypothetical protein